MLNLEQRTVATPSARVHQQAVIMRYLLAVLALVTALTVVSATSLRAPAQAPFAFADEFSGTALDTTAWIALNRGPDTSTSEQQCYLPGNVTEAGGALSIVSHADPSGCAALGGYQHGSGMVQWRAFNFT
jgi:hypothetical protein